MTQRQTNVVAADLTIRHEKLLITVQAAESGGDLRIDLKQGSLWALLKQTYPLGWFRAVRWMKQSSKHSGRTVLLSRKGRQLLRFKP